MFRRLKVIFFRIKSYGLVYGIKWLIVMCYHRVIPQKQVIWCIDLTKLYAKTLLLPDNIEIQRFDAINQVSQKDIEKLIDSNSDLMGSAASMLIRERFNKGAALWLLKENGQLAGYQWTISNNHETPTYLPHTETDVHTIGIELLKEFRGRDLLYLFQVSTFITLKNNGFKRHYLETYLWNKRALKAFSKIGLRKIGIARRFNFLGKNIVIWYDMPNTM